MKQKQTQVQLSSFTCRLILIIANEDKQMMRQKSSSKQSKGLFVLGEADISPLPVPDVKFLTISY